MGETKSHYDVLGVAIDATFDQIREAYRRLVKTHHPDRGGDPEEFVLISEAYTVLKDPETRKEYDVFGAEVKFDVKFFHETVIKSLAEMLEALLKNCIARRVSVDQVDFMGMIRDHAATVLVKTENDYAAIEHEIAELRKLLKRITRKGEEKNVFAEIIQGNIDAKIGPLAQASFARKVARRVNEEAQQYEDNNEFLRTMQAARYPGHAGSSTAGTSAFFPNFYRP